MRNAEEFSGQQSDLTRVLPTYRRPGARPGRGTEPGAEGPRPSGSKAIDMNYPLTLAVPRG